MKKPKLEPCIILSREGLQAVTSELVKAKLRAAEIKVEMEKKIADIQSGYQAQLDEVNREIATKEAGIYVWAQKNRPEFGNRKSIDLAMAIIGYRTSPPSVEQIRSKEKVGDIAARLPSVVDQASGFDGAKYVRDGAPTIDKEKLLSDREKIPAEVLALAGLRIVQEEQFYITPKSEVIDGTAQEAA